MAAVPPEIERAAGLPLLDAALLLWLNRHTLQRWDGKSSSPRLTGDPASQIRQAIGALDAERAQAASGPTRDRLKLAHPTPQEADLGLAIERAVKLDKDCASHFRHSGADLAADARRAVERARADNPGFLDASYEAAAQHLCMTMR
ncbi:MAG TPA: hypothetical protein VN728_13745 [Stellaceae bacterium]|jgi:hypothetical protein|nr:hypothetical protein [Stellaceae bacterium]